MSKTLDELVEQLQDDVPAVDGVPTEDSYERMVQEAVRDFSRRCGRKRRATLNIVSGTATYDLAADFLKMIALVSFSAHGGIINSPQGLIPVPENFCEEYTINNGQITFYPTPSYSLVREYTYKAAWVLNDEDYGAAYATMGDEEADIVLMKAKSSALDSLWRNNAGASKFKFAIGDESYDMSEGDTGTTLQTSRDSANKEYLTACEQYNGNTSRMM
jgi:hypothetical protein